MLKKISVGEVRLGMHLHALCGAWLDHPFWKSSFVLRTPAELDQLRKSNVSECWIDTSKGLDVGQPCATNAAQVPPPPPPPIGAPVQAAVSITLSPEPAVPAAHATSIEEELHHAAALVRRSRRAVQSLLSEARMGHAVDAHRCLPLVSDIAASVWRNSGALVSLARLKTHDDYSYMHSVAVCALMVTLSRQLGHAEDQAREAGLAGLLHDIGKVKMPLDLLNKPSKLTGTEYEVMKSHPLRGHHLLRESAGTTELALDVCLHHHERPDGRGYPYGLAGASLSVPARMGALCDVYDAITSNRPYKASWDPADSVSKMATWASAGQFDSALFQVFVKSLGIYPTGSLVRLESGRLAVVIEQNPRTLVSPCVRVFFSTQSGMPIRPEVLDLSQSACADRIAARESNAKWQFRHLDVLWAGEEILRGTGRAT